MSRVRKRLLPFLQLPQKYTYATAESTSVQGQENAGGGTDEDPFPSRAVGHKKNSLLSKSEELFDGSKLSGGYASTLTRKGTDTYGPARGLCDESRVSQPLAGIAARAQCVFALIKRYLLIKVRDVHRIANITYFPVTDVLIGGLMWFWQEHHANGLENTTSLYVCELTFWIIINAVQFETCFNLIEELQSRNIVNLFVSGLHHGQWLVASFILGVIEAFTAMLLCGTILHFFFSVSLWHFGWYLPCFFGLLALSGWTISIYTSSILIYHGQRMTVLLWALPYFIIPISAAFYPLEALPYWAQWIGSALPTTYLFEGLRAYFATQHVPVFYFIKSLLLVICYLIGAIALFNVMFKKSRAEGLARLEVD